MDERTPPEVQEAFLYPGHPLIIAYAALKVFPSAKAALDRDPKGHGWSAMVGCGAIPGGGDAAYAGDQVLRTIWNGDKTPQEAVTYADKLWAAMVGSENFAWQQKPGQAKSEKLREGFLALCAAWDWSK